MKRKPTRRVDEDVTEAEQLLTDEERKADPPPPDGDDPVDEAAADSFPASDPPSYTPLRAGRPEGTD